MRPCSGSKKCSGRSLSWTSSTSRLSIISAPSSAASASIFWGSAGGAGSDADSAMRTTSAMANPLGWCGPTPNENKVAQSRRLWIVCARIARPSAEVRKSSSRPSSTEIIRPKLKASDRPVRPSAWRFCPTAGFASRRRRTRMIEPFVEAQRRDGCISYGLSSYGYDARVADDFKIFTNVDSAIVDPKNFDVEQLRRPQDRRAASSRPTASRWRGRSNISGCRATCSSSASANRPMRGAGSS